MPTRPRTARPAGTLSQSDGTPMTARRPRSGAAWAWAALVGTPGTNPETSRAELSAQPAATQKKWRLREALTSPPRRRELKWSRPRLPRGENCPVPSYPSGSSNWLPRTGSGRHHRQADARPCSANRRRSDLRRGLHESAISSLFRHPFGGADRTPSRARTVRGPLVQLRGWEAQRVLMGASQRRSPTRWQ